jgi:hypothetical protein
MKMSKWLVILLVVICSPIILFNVDKLYGKIDSANTPKKTIRVEVGDIIFRTKSYILSGGKYYYKSGMPGHLAIAISEGDMTDTDSELGGIEVIESAFYNRYKGNFQSEVAVNKAFENFGDIRGKRFLLKMHLNGEQKKKLTELVQKQIGKPYRIWASKNSQDSFNCATFARWAILEVAGFDLDSDAGYMVFPNDILKSPRFDKQGDRIRF